MIRQETIRQQRKEISIFRVTLPSGIADRSLDTDKQYSTMIICEVSRTASLDMSNVPGYEDEGDEGNEGNEGYEGDEGDEGSAAATGEIQHTT